MRRVAGRRLLAHVGAAVFAVLLARSAEAADTGERGACAALREQLFTPDGKLRDFPSVLHEHANPTVLSCRAEVAAGGATALVGALAQALPRSADAPPSNAAALVAVCALRPREPWAVSWFVRGARDGWEQCLAASATVDTRETRAVVDAVIGRLVVYRTRPPAGEAPFAIDGGVLHAASFGPELYRRLGPSLARAYDLRAQGYPQLHVYLCAPTVGAPAVDAATCARFTPHAPARSTQSRTSSKVIGTAVVLSLAGGVVAAGVATRDNDGGRAIAAGALGLGAGLALAAMIAREPRSADGVPALGSGLTSLYAGFWGTVTTISTSLITYFALDGSAGTARVITTSVGMSLVSLGAVTFVW